MAEEKVAGEKMKKNDGSKCGRQRLQFRKREALDQQREKKENRTNSLKIKKSRTIED